MENWDSKIIPRVIIWIEWNTVWKHLEQYPVYNKNQQLSYDC